MAGIIDELLSAAANNTVSRKQREVVDQSQLKQQGILGEAQNFDGLTAAASVLTGQGQQTQTDLDFDTQTLSNIELRAKYGEDIANPLIQRRDQGMQRYVRNERSVNSPGEAVTDALGSLAVGAGSTGYIGALGVGAFDDEAGAAVSDLLQRATETIQGTQSERTQGARENYQARQTLSSRDNLAQRNQEADRGSEIIADLSRVGRDAIDAVTNTVSDSSSLIDGLAQAGGSLLGGGLAGRAALSGISKAAGKDVAGNAAVQSTTMAGVIGSMEGGGAYADVMNRVMAMNHEQLMQTSAFYRKTFEMTGDAEEAKLLTASTAAKKAAAKVAPIAAATGAAVGRFELSPLAPRSAAGAARNMGLETTEEAIQGTASPLISNTEIRNYADENQDISAGVGEGLGLGALYGAGVAGVIQTPGVAVQKVYDAGSAITGSLVQRADAVRRANEQTSPVAEERILEASQHINTAAPEVISTFEQVVQSAPPEQAEKARSYTDTLLDLGIHREGQYTNPVLNEVTTGAASKMEAIQRLADLVADDAADGKARIDAGIELLKVEQNVFAALEADMTTFEQLADDHPAAVMVNDILNTTHAAVQNPKVSQALAAIHEMLSNPQEPTAPITRASIDTPEGQQNIQRNVDIAAVAPENANLEAIQQILYHADQGSITLTTSQRNALRMASALIQAERAKAVQGDALGLSPEAVRVSNEITLESGNKGKSVADHAKGIYTALRNGDMEMATERMTDMGNFAQHMLNKVTALQNHMEAGPRTPKQRYQAWNPEQQKWFDAGPYMFYEPTSEASVRTAQSIHQEATLAISAYNNMLDAFPLIEASKLPVPELHPKLTIHAVKEESDDTEAEATTVVNVQDMDDAALTAEVIRLQDKALRGEATDQDSAIFAQYEDELNRREDAAYEAMQAQQQQEQEPVRPAEPAPVKEPVADTTPVVEPETVTETPQAQPEAVQEAEPEVQQREGILSAYPALLGASLDKVKNVFGSSFKFPENPRIRFPGIENPLSNVRSTLYEDIGKVLGSKWAGRVDDRVADTWTDYLKTADVLNKTIDRKLVEFLHAPRKDKKGRNLPTMMERLQSGTPVNQWENGLLLNIADETTRKNKAGKEQLSLRLNSELVENASLATLHWMLNSNQFARTLDAEDVAKILGVSDLSVSTGTVEFFNTGLVSSEAISSLAQKIVSFWGLQEDNNGFIGDQQGITESLAREFILAAEQQGMLQRIEERFAIVDGRIIPASKVKKGDKVTYKDIIKFELVNPFVGSVTNQEAKYNQLKATSSLLEEIQLLEPTEVRYIGKDAVPPVSVAQLRNPLARLTKQQKKVLERVQNTEYFFDTTMVGLYGILGRDALVSAFGTDMSNPQLFNTNHAISIQGQNDNIAYSYNELQSILQEASAIAEVDGTEVSATPMKFKYEFSGVNRLQMQGRYNPQSSKLLREVLLPTWSTLDLTNPQHMNNFMLSLAQGLDISIHKMLPEEALSKVNKLVTGPLAPAVEQIRQMLDRVNPDVLLEQQVGDPVDLSPIKAAYQSAGVPFNPLSFHALVEYTKSLNAEDRSAFKTSIYLEADGMTNGPINAMMLLSSGMFTPQWIQNMERGGYYINQTDMTANEKNGNGLKDLYNTAAEMLQQILKDTRNPLDPTQEALFWFFNQFSNDFYAEEDAIEISRNLIKNPLTVITYGSGIGGVANKMTGNIVDALYSRMSDALQLLAANPEMSVPEALFPGSSPDEANVLAGKFNDALQVLTGSSNNFGDLSSFTLDVDSLKNLSDIVQSYLAEPMYLAITETMGSSVLDNANRLRGAVGAMSIYASALQKQLIEEKQREYRNSDTDYRPRQLLTRKDMREIEKKVMDVAAYIQTDNQNFFITGSDSFSVAARTSTSLDGQLQMSGALKGFGDAGVKAIAYINIGSGDGQMIQNGVTNSSPVADRQLPVFDGVNTPADLIQEGGSVMNKAVWDSWKGNPIEAIAERFRTFIKEADLTILSDKERLAMSRALWDQLDKPTALSVGELRELQIRQYARLTDSAKEIKARHELLQKIPAAIDQMAGTGQNYVNKGDMELTTVDPTEISNVLNAQLNAKQESVSNIAEALEAAGRKTESGVLVANPRGLRQLLSQDILTKDQKDTLHTILNSDLLRGWKIIAGAPGKITEYIESKGVGSQQLTEALSAGHRGFTAMQDKTIFLLNNSAETLVHEMIHAATFQKVSDYYADGNLSQEDTVAIEKIEALMHQFIDAGTAEVAHLGSTFAVTKKLQGILKREMAEGNHAVALNEYMAWTLTNRELAERAKKTKASKLVQITKDTWQALKTLIFGKKYAPRVGKDVYSNLRFNTAVLVVTAPSVSELNSTAPILNQEGYGTEPRLQNLERALGTFLSDYLTSTNTVPGHRPTVTRLASEIILAEKVADTIAAAHFEMDQQQVHLFKALVTALSTQGQLDSQALNEAQRMFAHVTKNLSVESFMENMPEEERYYAQEKFNAVTGKTFTGTDRQGRSTILPAFIALSIVNPEFREILRRIPMPKQAVSDATGIDGYLENFGYKTIESLGQKFAGTSKASNVTEAMDLLSQRMVEQIEAKENAAEVLMNTSGRWVDRVNDCMVEMATVLSDKLLPEMTEAEKAQRNIWNKALDSIKAGLAAVISEEKGEVVAEGVSRALDNSNVSQWIRDLFSDFTGRTESNKLIYDMIKGVRSKIQAVRQNYRDNLPKIIRGKFTRELEESEWASLQRSMAKTDLASLVLSGMTQDDALLVAADETARTTKIRELEDALSSISNTAAQKWIDKSVQLAHFMNTGEAGTNLLRNASAIAGLFNEGVTNPVKDAKEQGNLVNIIDQLVSLHAIQNLNQGDKDKLTSLIETQRDGIKFSLSYLMGQVQEEKNKMTDITIMNHYKGHIPFEMKGDVSLIVADSSRHAELLERGYTYSGIFTGSNVMPTRGKGYYFMPASAKAAFNQGIMQNVKHTVSGVDASTGFTNGIIVNRITDPTMVKRITQRLSRENTSTPLLPVFDEAGKVFAYEQSIDPAKQASVAAKEDLAATIGKWRGRQAEEHLGSIFNSVLIENLHTMYEKDKDKGRYENLFKSKDPIIMDAISLMTPETRANIKATFGDEFMVQKGMVKDVLGYRDASLGEAWTGITRLSPEKQKMIRNMAMGIFGNEAYKRLTSIERVVENLASNARVLIAVKSGIVPAINIISNLLHLVSRGVPIRDMMRNIPRKTAEIHTYVESRIRLMAAEAELRAAVLPNERRKLEAEIRSIEDSHTRMSIWPLIQAGEFTAISDVDMREEDLRLTSGKLAEYIDNAVDKLPKGVATTGRYLMVSKDTALYSALQKSVEYGDFVSKAILYDDLVGRQNKTHEEALGAITEEFVNYDQLPGRARGKLEKLGLLWFYNFKLRSTKIALSTVRNNPLHTLLAASVPVPGIFGDPGLPIDDNVISKAAEGTLGYSIGPGQGMSAPALNPWLNLVQ